VIAAGLVPATRGDKVPVKFLSLKAVTGPHGQLAQSAAEYIEVNPEAAGALGKVMGMALGRMHQAFSPRSFGEYGDMLGSEDAFPIPAAE
jgi:hypothetical protein